MTEQKKTRREKLEEMLAKSPNDAFTLYGLALECKNSGDFAAAENYFQRLLKANPDYVPGYQMYAQSLAQNDRSEDARAVLNQGIQAAQRAGNHHALSEMEGLLSELS
jgi:cytochrome c-type biogenesis protein CcmH/NrfG